MVRAHSEKAPVETSLLLRVELPAVGFDFLQKFSVKPGAVFSRVQTAIVDTFDELAVRLEGDLLDAGPCSNDLYQVAKLRCEQHLQDWQAKLSQATTANLRVQRARSELARMREAYYREVAGLRQQLVRKQQAEERGDEFVPDIISHFSVSERPSEAEVDELLEEQKKRLEEQHLVQLERLTKENQQLLYKLKTKAMQANLQGDLLAKRMEAPEQLDAATQTVVEKRESKATETVCVSTSTAEVQTLDDVPMTDSAANRQSKEVQEEVDLEVDDLDCLDCLDLDVTVTSMEIPEANRANSRRKNSKARERSAGSVATNDSEALGKRASQRRRSTSRDLSGLRKAAPPKISVERDSSVSDRESSVGSVCTEVSRQPAPLAANRSERGIQTSLDAEVLRAAEEVLDGRHAKPESPVSPRWRQIREAQLRRTKVSTMSTQVDPTMLGPLELQEPAEPRELREPVRIRRPWTQGLESPAAAFPAFATEDERLVSLDSDEEEADELPWKFEKSSPQFSTLPELKSPKKAAVTLPSPDDISGPLLFSVSSQGHSAAMLSRSDGARPSQRTISRPKLSQTSTPSPRAKFGMGG